MSLKITVITICYNEENNIEKTIISAINQTYSNFEFIVIDGGSTDSTVSILNKYSNHFTYWISEKDNGIYDAWNKGVSFATGDYTFFLQGGDSFYNNDVLTKVSDFITNQTTKIDVLYGTHEYIDTNTHQSNIFKVGEIEILTKMLPFSPSASFFRTSLLIRLGFNSSYSISGDYDMIARIYAIKGIFKYLDLPIIKFSPGGISSMITMRLIIEDYKAQSNITNSFKLKREVCRRTMSLFRFKAKLILLNRLNGVVIYNVFKYLKCKIKKI